MSSQSPRGRFLILDGVDGCGKTTQAGLLATRLGALHLREPGSTSVGEKLRELLLDPEVSMGAGCETLLFAAARRQMLEEIVEPALATGKDVVCERYHSSTFAYQAVAGDLGEQEVLGLLRHWAGAPTPECVVILELDVDQAAARRAERGAEDRIEARGLEYQRRVAQGYRRYAELNDHVALVCATGTPEEVSLRVWSAVQDGNL
jgi:dTMP kinase